MAKQKYVWLGNNVAAGLKADADAEPIAVGQEIALTEAQVAQLEATGHRFAAPGSKEARGATPPGPTDPPADPPK